MQIPIWKSNSEYVKSLLTYLVSEAFFCIIGNSSWRRNLDEKSPHKSGHKNKAITERGLYRNLLPVHHHPSHHLQLENSACPKGLNPTYS